MPLPLDTRFTLGSEISSTQKKFLDQHGFLVFAKVATSHELAAIISEVRRIESEWLREGRVSIYGIPLFIGRDEQGEEFIHRLAFTSAHSESIRSFVRDERFEPIRRLIAHDARVGDREKDGVVMNRYLRGRHSAYGRLGWHTDGLRDLFYLRKPAPMLNVGLHFDRIQRADGGLRLIPGTHNQSFRSMCFRKPYFISHKPDPNEIAVETEPGDLTVHDGRLWHRVAPSPHTGLRSLRRTMYVPYLSDTYHPKDENSPTPLYHRVAGGVRRARRLITGLL